MTTTPDHYAALGVAPTSEDVVIRAAYRALMRRYHPDAGGDAESAERARAINAAYAVLSNPERRARYDAARRGPPPAAAVRPEPVRRERFAEPRDPRRRSMAGPVVAGLLSLGALGLLAYALIQPPAGRPGPAAPQVASVAANIEPTPTPAPLAERPAPDNSAEVPVEIDPQLQPIVEVEPEQPRVAAPRPVPPRLPRLPAPAAKVPSVTPAVAAPLPPAAKPAASPDRSADLALLESRAQSFWDQSWRAADADRRARLMRSREAFALRRDRCRTDSCRSDAYLNRLREISAIMGGDAARN